MQQLQCCRRALICRNWCEATQSSIASHTPASYSGTSQWDMLGIVRGKRDIRAGGIIQGSLRLYVRAQCLFFNRKSYGPVRCGFQTLYILPRGSVLWCILRCGSVLWCILRCASVPLSKIVDVTVLSVIPCILPCGLVRFSETRNPTVRFGAVIYRTVRFGAVLKITESYGVVRCSFHKS